MTGPTFLHDSAREVFEALAPKRVESPRLATARRALTNAAAGEHRDRLAAALIRQAETPDEVEALWQIAAEMNADAADRQETEIREQVAKSLTFAEDRAARFPAERRSDETVEEWHARLDVLDANGTEAAQD